MTRNSICSLLLVLCLSAAPRASATCIDYDQHIHWTGGNSAVGTGTYEEDMVVVGTTAYLAAVNTRLQIVDVSSPASPTLLGSITLTGGGSGTLHTTGVTVVGSLAYVTAAYAGLFIVNVSNPASPAIVGFVDTPGVAEDVAVAGTRAYVADYSSGLQVVNISNPAAPAIIGHVDTPGDAFGVALNGSVAYVADEFAGVHVINISNPLSPTILGTIGNPGTVEAPGNAQDLVAVGSTLYVADGKSGLVVIDASSPSSPVLLGSLDTPGYAWEVRIQGSRAYIADDTKGLTVIDITNPSSPTLLATKATPGTARALAVANTAGFVLDQNYGLETFDPSAVAPVFILGNVGPISDDWRSLMIGATGSLVCVPNHQSLVIINTSNPLSPQIVNSGTLLLPGSCGGVALSGTTAYVACGSFLVLDLSNPSNPQVLGGLDSLGANDVAISGTKAFVIAFHHFPDDPVGSISQRLVVIDIADSHNPVILGTLITTGRYPIVSGTLVYLAGGQIDVVDVSTPAQPTLIGGINITGWLSGYNFFPPRSWMAISGNYGFVSVFQTDGSGGKTASGVAKLELTPSPESPRLLGITSTPGGTGGVAASGTTVFAAAGERVGGGGNGNGGGIYVFDGTNMSMIGAADVQAFNVVAAGGLVYAMTWKGNVSSLVIVPDHCEGAQIAVEPGPGFQRIAGLGAAFPNPGRFGSTIIPFTVSKHGSVTLRIVDASGREVRTLVNDLMDPGERRAEWDGRNARGERVPAGIYVYELRAPGVKAARKLVRLR